MADDMFHIAALVTLWHRLDGISKSELVGQFIESMVPCLCGIKNCARRWRSTSRTLHS
jgi:hypothetical protein